MKYCHLCNKYAIFGLVNECPTSCGDHKNEFMIDVRNPKCSTCLIKRANYKNLGFYYCKEHKPLNTYTFMIHARICIVCNKTQSYFNFSGLKSKYCFNCKLTGMVNVNVKKCLLCDEISLYNYKGIKMPQYCKTHKLEGMINCHNNICINEGCLISSSYGIEKAIHCSLHKIEGERNFNKRKMNEI